MQLSSFQAGTWTANWEFYFPFGIRYSLKCSCWSSANCVVTVILSAETLKLPWVLTGRKSVCVQQFSVERKPRRHDFVIIILPKRRDAYVWVCRYLLSLYLSLKAWKWWFCKISNWLGDAGFFPRCYSYPNS